jgi:nuclear transport factor 2 (NTF2) superfamily protein
MHHRSASINNMGIEPTERKFRGPLASSADRTTIRTISDIGL